MFLFLLTFSFSFSIYNNHDFPIILRSNSIKSFIPSVYHDVPINTENNYLGDGRHYVSSGDTVILDNGLKIIINKITFDSKIAYGEKNAIFLYLTFSLDNILLNTNPIRFRLSSIPENNIWNGFYANDYGVSISLPSKNTSEKIKSKYINRKISYYLKFNSSEIFGNKLTFEKLYDNCLLYNSKKDCFVYIPYVPLDEEYKVENQYVSLILDKDSKDIAKKYLKQATSCYLHVYDILGIYPKVKKAPIRLINNFNAGLTLSTSGILLDNSWVSSDNSCNSPMLVHELTHYFTNPLPLRDIYKEGLSTYVQNTLQYNDYMKLIKEDFIIRDSISTFNEGKTAFSLYSLDNNNANVINYIMVNANWYPSSFNTKISLNKGAYSKDDLFPIMHFKGIVGNSIIVDIYERKIIKNTFECYNNGFQEYSKWFLEDKYLYADFSISPLNSYLFLENYSNSNLNWKAYITSACLFDYIFNNLTIKTFVKSLANYDFYKEEGFPLWGYLSSKNINLEYIQSVFGVNILEKQYPPYTYFISGNKGQY